MINKGLIGLISLALTIPGASYVLDQIQKPSEYTTAVRTITPTLENAWAINQINPTTSMEEALQRSVSENRKAEGMTTDGTYVYYTVGTTCFKGHLVDMEYPLVEYCEVVDSNTSEVNNS